MKNKIITIMVMFIGLILVNVSGCIDISPASLYGDDFTINSISPTQVISNDADLNTANFIVSATANGGGQSIVGTFDAAEFKEWSGYEITYPLSINIANVGETFIYPIRNDGTPLYKLRAVKVNRESYWTGASCTGSDAWKCFDLYDTPDQYGLGNDAIVKVYRDEVGAVGSFDNPSIKWFGDITMTVQGTAITQKFDSATAQSLDFYSGGEWKGTARWTGSLISGNPVPSQDLYKAVYLKSRSSWTVSAYKYYDEYKSATFSPLKTKQFCLPDNSNCFYESDITTPITAYNSKVDVLTAQNDKITYTGVTGTSFQQTISGGEQNGNVISSSTFAVGYPVFQFIVKAKSLGVLIPVGKPQITSVSAPTFSSGDNTGTVTVTFKNIGTVTASFTASISQINSPFYQQGTATPISVSPGASGTISLMIGHGTAVSGSVTGTVKVYDTNKPSNYDEKPFTTSMTEPKTCTPGSFDVRGNIVYKCKSDGTGYELFLDCKSGSTPKYESGTYICIETTSGPTGTATGTATGTGTPSTTTDITYKDWSESPWLLIGILITLISGLYILSTRSKKYGKK